jgi:hypothetical protein
MMTTDNMEFDDLLAVFVRIDILHHTAQGTSDQPRHMTLPAADPSQNFAP